MPPNGPGKLAAKSQKEFRRLNRSVSVGDVAMKAVEPVLRKRGFASADILTHWKAIVPPPYGEAVMPDKLVWPKNADGEREAAGAVLQVRVSPAVSLQFNHEIPALRDAINRYFGFYLIAEIKPSRTPFIAGSAAKTQDRPIATDKAVRDRVQRQTEGTSDDELRDALQRLGEGIARRNSDPKRSGN